MTYPLPIVGYINPLVADALRDPTSGINVTQLRAERNGCVSAPLVLKTDADAEIAKLREYYAANEDIKRVGLFGATLEMFAREEKARAALKGPEA
ncbi:hypothetical protein BJI49_09735 [Acetobacter pasteurianus]|uniref:hypothetical protein n=1 Tax=Acetobacter pasteurianus TaxID=438 RepID=UPI0002457226|nr:hypothetical protein [Acetobacter pasteurianus]RCL05802.1 hypothetical protein BJI49_09735 [Acetobacter pasteurianus]GAB32151.1 hypothetical protein APS_2754 [Acetobacter pasteurianus subsp. pasteurianus LMG 1262 = NBRC 106471]GCD50132.1 hypothetical protein NBRC106471_1688 [Acetobacter pasteurianus subsp. pasteurianus LMG 1262 = NBRC 106471]